MLYKAGKKTQSKKPTAMQRRRPTKYRPAKLSKPVKKAIVSIVKKQQELKIAQQIGLADSVNVSGTGLLYDGVTNLRGWCSGPTGINGIIPAVPTGTGEANKIGNRIMPKSLILKYFLMALPTTDSTFTGGNTNPFKGVPFRVRVIVFRHKYAIDDYSQTNILQNGNSSNSFGSGIDNFFRPYNKDEFTIVYSKTIKMAAVKHVSGATGATITTENVPNGALSFYAGSARIPLPKTLRFNDGADVATNAGYFLAVCYCNEDSTPDSAGAYRRVQLNAETQMTFYDA